MRKVLIVIFLIFAVACAASAQESHEYAPVKEQEINYKDWTFKDMQTDAPVHLRQWAQGKKLVMVVYFAPWCHNWQNEAPIVSKFYDKYHAQGFDVIAVSEYGTKEDMHTFFADKNVPYTVVVESDVRDARDKTTHYGYRQLTGDTRKWGSPFNIFLTPSKLAKSGDVLTEKAYVVVGELIEHDAEKFIRQQLGLKEEAATPQP